MSRRTMVAALAAVLLLGGCGIPEFSGVQVVGRAPEGEGGSYNGRGGQPPPRTASGSDPKKFVHNYLAAAAGEPDRAYERVKQFIAPERKQQLQEKQGSDVAVNVVRLRDVPVPEYNSDGTISVRIPVQQVGLLRANGTLAPPVATESEYVIRLRGTTAGNDNGEGELWVIDAPNALLLRDTALREYYKQYTIYFWSTSQTQLVPDHRYLPDAVPDGRRVTEVVKWLTGGPPDWLGSGVARLPDRTELINNATETDGRWEVNLAMTGEDDAKLERLATQIIWSLPELDGELELKVRNQTQLVVKDIGQHRQENPIYPIGRNPQRYCVYDGTIYPLAVTGELIGTVPIDPAANRDVVSAALSWSGDTVLAALVTGATAKRQRLVVGSGAAPVVLNDRSAQTFDSVGRPVWLRSAAAEAPLGLVVADGRLYRFDRAATLIEVPLSVSGPVTAVAAALEGHRIAFIAGGGLYVATVSLDGDALVAGTPRRLATSLTDLSAVDWAGENALVLAGVAGQPAVYEISVDGARETALKGDVGAQVTQLTAYPRSSSSPAAPLASGPVMYEANGVAWADSPFTPIPLAQVVDAVPPTNGSRAGNPTAPFFLY